MEPSITLQPRRSNIIRYAAAMTATTVLALVMWPGLVGALFGTGNFLPHSFCYLRDSGLVWTHAITDTLIGLSYVAISASLTLLVHRTRRDIPFSWVFLAFGLFIVACATTHFMEVLVLWKATYWLSAAVKIVTAVASVATALALPPLIPKTIALVREAKKSEERRLALEDRLEALERERAARVEAEEASKAKDAFLAIISHELRTPMTPILGWASLLSNSSPDEELLRTGLAAIERSAKAQTQVIDDLLDVSRIVTGHLRLQPRLVNLAEVVTGAVEALALTAEAKTIAIDAENAASTIVLVADASRLHQVVTNLLSNALKFSTEGSTVTVRTRGEDGRAVLTVEDRGAGIDSEFLPFMFDRFTQADPSATRSFGGLGLGLAIVKHLVELHGGTVRAESAGIGRGSTFTVELPIPAEVSAAPPIAETHPRVDLAGTHILIVEDDPATREMLHAALTRDGAEVAIAASVSEAMRIVESERVDVVVTDVAMPREDGLSLLRRLTERAAPNGTRIPVIVLSALVGGDSWSKIRLAGFDAHLRKPVEPLLLTETVLKVLGR